MSIHKTLACINIVFESVKDTCIRAHFAEIAVFQLLLESFYCRALMEKVHQLAVTRGDQLGSSEKGRRPNWAVLLHGGDLSSVVIVRGAYDSPIARRTKATTKTIIFYSRTLKGSTHTAGLHAHPNQKNDLNRGTRVRIISEWGSWFRQKNASFHCPDETNALPYW